MLNPKRLLKINTEEAETTMWFWVWFAGAFAVMDTVAAAVGFGWLAAPTDVLWMLAATSWMVTATFRDGGSVDQLQKPHKGFGWATRSATLSHTTSGDECHRTPV